MAQTKQNEKVPKFTYNKITTITYIPLTVKGTELTFRN